MLEQYVVPLRKGKPSSSWGGRIAFRRGHDGEIPAGLVGANVEEILAVIDVVAVFLFTRQEHREVALRMVSAQPAKLGGVLGRTPKKDKFLVARFLDGDVV